MEVQSQTQLCVKCCQESGIQESSTLTRYKYGFSKFLRIKILQTNALCTKDRQTKGL